MPVLLSNLPVQATNPTRLTQNQSKKQTSTFGLPKLTKTSQKTESDDNKTSKTTGIISGVKPQLKSPSIQFNSNSPLKIPVVSRIASTNSAKNSPSTSIKKSNVPSKSKFFSSANKNSPSTSNSAIDTSTFTDKSDEKKNVYNKESDLDDEMLGSMNDISEDNVNEEEFQKFLNLDEENIEK